MSLLVERLAEEAALNCGAGKHIVACGFCIRTALRAALREAAKVAEQHSGRSDSYRGQYVAEMMAGGAITAHEIAAALEALAE